VTRVARVDTSKLHVRFAEGAGSEGLSLPRRYTLTHSDRSGDLYLTIGAEYDRAALRAFQTRIMRDEVLAEWVEGGSGLELAVHCVAQGGLPIFGSAGMRCDVFRHYKDMVLSAIRYADRVLVAAEPELDDAPVTVTFHYRRQENDHSESWGRFGDWE
jgi:hypothetical protein